MQELENSTVLSCNHLMGQKQSSVVLHSAFPEMCFTNFNTSCRLWKLYERSKCPFVTRHKALRWNRRIAVLIHNVGYGKGLWLTSRPIRFTSRAGWNLGPVCSGMENSAPTGFPTPGHQTFMKSCRNLQLAVFCDCFINSIFSVYSVS
jgi:hypothetical protein